MMCRPLALLALALALQEPAAEGKRWWRHIEVLADDALEGRHVGTPGFEKAASYVEAQFKAIGLTPGGTAGYRQPVKFESRLLIPEHSTLTLVRDGVEVPLAVGLDATISARSELDGQIDAPMVFIGYGLSIPEANWDELSRFDLRGKIAVYINTAAPVEVSDNVKSHVGSIGERWAALKRAGAIGIATLPSPRPAAPTPPTGPAPTPAAPGAAPATPATPQPPQPFVALADRELQEYAGMTVSVTIGRRAANTVLAGTGHTIEELDRLVTARQPLPVFPLPGSLRARAIPKRDAFVSDNIVGIHEGSDAVLRHEYVVMSAHLDHVGVGRAVDGDGIYNGAMDDASGVASVIEIARLLKESGAKTRRSILFIAHTAEEKGLLGSTYFAARPSVPAGSLVANVNLDMFLPLYPLKIIEVQGLTESSLGETVRLAARDHGVNVQTDREPEQNRFVRSDQYSFIQRGIPALAFKFGYEFGSPEETIRRNWVRDLYHEPKDDVKQPVDLAAAATFNRIILGLLQRVANDEARPSWYDGSFFRRFTQ